MLPERVWLLTSKCWATVMGERDIWVTVRFPDGSIGTVPRGVVAMQPPEEPAEQP